jgi:hypothetical protein
LGLAVVFHATSSVAIGLKIIMRNLGDEMHVTHFRALQSTEIVVRQREIINDAGDDGCVIPPLDVTWQTSLP